MTARHQIRVHGDASLPTLIYLPGIHGDWTLVSSFRAAVAGRVRFVEFTYFSSATASLDDYTDAIEDGLRANGIEKGWLLGESFGSQPAWALIGRTLPKTGTSRYDVPPATTGGGGSVSVCETARNRQATQNSSSKSPVADRAGSPSFRPLGLVLAGGFVRHPVIPGVRVVEWISGKMPMTVIRWLICMYERYARFRHRHAPETAASIKEFVANRVRESDRLAITRRYRLIADNDLRAIPVTTEIPVFYLAGLVDPLVPWPFVRLWLKRHCPGYREGKTFWKADHNILGTQPKAAAEQVIDWISSRSR